LFFKFNFKLNLKSEICEDYTYERKDEIRYDKYQKESENRHNLKVEKKIEQIIKDNPNQVNFERSKLIGLTQVIYK
jgi:hypothetical protein